MHPAFSVIFFTTSSGAGYGLLALMGIGAAAGLMPDSAMLAIVGLGLALAMITAGLLSSTFHLGHPERAWRAFSQWRSSWLSREGVLSVLTYIPAVIFSGGWVLFGVDAGFVRIAGLLAALGALATVVTTAMIYASLKPIPDWSNRFTLPVYLAFSLATGAILLNGIQALTVAPVPALRWLAIVFILIAWALKVAAWRHNDSLALPTAASATGLGTGEVRSIEWPHTQENYILKEMGYQVARKHAARLRRIAQGLAFALPLVLILIGALAGPAATFLPVLAAVLAVLSMVPGVLTERWLFFAEARHTAALYYGYPHARTK